MATAQQNGFSIPQAWPTRLHIKTHIHTPKQNWTETQLFPNCPAEMLRRQTKRFRLGKIKEKLPRGILRPYGVDLFFGLKDGVSLSDCTASRQRRASEFGKPMSSDSNTFGQPYIRTAIHSDSHTFGQPYIRTAIHSDSLCLRIAPPSAV